jgi:heat shock protein HslJ
MEQDRWFVAFLEAGPQVTVDGDAIELRTDDTVVRGRDREVADPDRPLEGTEWQIASRLDVESASASSWMESSRLVFEPGGTITGATDCGPVEGTWSLAGDVLMVDLAERGPCAGQDSLGEDEDQTFALLDGELTVEIEAGQARLMRPDGKGVELREGPPAP